LILVDGNLPGNNQALLKGVQRISDQPVRLVIITSSDKWQASDSEKFLETGALLAVQENAKQNLLSSVPLGAAAQVKTYEQEHMVRLGGVEAQLMHFGNAHSNADSIVYFPNLKAVAVGDLYAAAPNPDYAAGGSLLGWVPVLAEVLKLDFDIAVPSQGPTVTRGDVEKFKTRLEALVTRARSLVGRGVPKDQFMSQLKTDDLGWKLNFTPAQIDGFYAELSRTGQPVHAAELNVQSALQK